MEINGDEFMRAALEQPVPMQISRVVQIGRSHFTIEKQPDGSFWVHFDNVTGPGFCERFTIPFGPEGFRNFAAQLVEASSGVEIPGRGDIDLGPRR